MKKADKNLPFSQETAQTIAHKFGTPLYVYDEQGIEHTIREMNQVLGRLRNYKNFFAVKATPTPEILRLVHKQGMGFDCSSRTELLMMKRLGVTGKDIFYTSNNTPKEDFELAIELGATVNIDDLTQVPVFIEALNGKSYHSVALRYNPGDKKTGNAIIGEPVEAKFGMTRDQLVDAYRQLKAANIQQFGLHLMVASNELGERYFAETAELAKETAAFVETEADIQIGFINLGGGFGVPYQPNNEPLNIKDLGDDLEKIFANTTYDIYTENGRFVTGPHGYLLTQVRYIMQKYKSYVGVDASMHNLMRPGMYGAYHHISVLGKKGKTTSYDVVGSLCENNDKFAVDRLLPEIASGDLLVIHDAGAHAYAMGFNYNGLLRSAEVLLKGNGSLKLIRHAETTEDYFRNMVW